MSLGETIARLRRRRNWNQKELAERLGIDQRNISRWETGKVRPRVKALEELAQVLEVPLSELLNGGVPEAVPASRLDDPELVELLAQLPRLGEPEKDALKTVLRAMLTRSQIAEVIGR